MPGAHDVAFRRVMAETATLAAGAHVLNGAWHDLTLANWPATVGAYIEPGANLASLEVDAYLFTVDIEHDAFARAQLVVLADVDVTQWFDVLSCN